MSIFRTFFFLLLSLFLSVSLQGQNIHYDNTLNYSGSRMEHDSLEPLAVVIDGMMPSAVTTDFKAFSVAAYSLVGYQQSQDQDTVKSQVLSAIDAQSPYHLVFWWTPEGSNPFKDVELKFKFPNDNDFGNCFTDAKISLIKAQLQQYANTLISTAGPEANTYISLEVSVLQKARDLVRELSSCCANANKSAECTLCVSGEGLALMKYNEGVRELPTAEPLNSAIDYNASFERHTGDFHDYVGKALFFGEDSISLLDEYNAFIPNAKAGAAHHVYFVNDGYFCQNPIPGDATEGYSIIIVTQTSEGFELEVKHHKVGDALTYAEGPYY